MKRLVGLGFTVVVEKGAGFLSRIPEPSSRRQAPPSASRPMPPVPMFVLKVKRPSESELKGYRRGAVVLAAMDPYGNDKAVAAMAAAGISALAMEFMPRYHARPVDGRALQPGQSRRLPGVIDAAAEYDRAMPMMMTAAGTVPAARVFVMGAGVAGLQAHRHRQAPRRGRYRHRRAPRRQGTGRLARREIHRGRGRRVQGWPRRRAATQGDVDRNTRPSRPRWWRSHIAKPET